MKMNKCRYSDIPNDSEDVMKIHKNSTWKPFLKQLLICSGVWMSVFLYGLCVAAPTVFIPQIEREANNTEIITEEKASWITSAFSFSGFPFVIIVSISTKFFGRKIPFTISILITIATLTVLYCSTNVTQILISEIMLGVYSAAVTTIPILMLTEYISPRYRGIFLLAKTATFFWGAWVSNAIGTFFHWKNIPLVGIVCSLYTLLIMFTCPESPIWLASKGRFEECAASHRSLKGCDEDSEKELEALINSQKEYIDSCDNTNLSARKRVLHFFETIKSKEFYKPTALAILTSFLSTCSGKLVFAVYAIDVLKKITNSVSTAYVAMLIIDGFTVFSMYVGCALSQHLKRRTLLLVASSIGGVFLFILSLYLYLITLNVIIENKYVTISLFVGFTIAVSCGPLSQSIAVYGELIPIRSRNLSMCIIALSGKIQVGLSLKVAFLLFRSIRIHGACLAYGIVTVIVIILLYKYLPETKDKTLQEIADSMMGVTPNSEVTLELLNRNKER